MLFWGSCRFGSVRLHTLPDSQSSGSQVRLLRGRRAWTSLPLAVAVFGNGMRLLETLLPQSEGPWGASPGYWPAVLTAVERRTTRVSIETGETATAMRIRRETRTGLGRRIATFPVSTGSP